MMVGMAPWDIFLIHASEDAASVAEPMARQLSEAGLRVWLDSEQVTLGDSLRRRIDEGLAGARFGVVVLSPSFFKKEWPQRELEAILSLEIASGKRILPVLHELDREALLRHSPLLADKVSVSTADGLGTVTREILRALGQPVTLVPAAPIGEPELLVGTVVNGYTLTAFVGSGGSGSVFIATHPQYRRKLALKVFFPLRPGYRHLFGLFQRGFRAVAAVRHPNVISIVDSGT